MHSWYTLITLLKVPTVKTVYPLTSIVWPYRGLRCRTTCGKFMQHLETCLLIAEADKVLCHLVTFLTVFFVWMYMMKYSCYQVSSVIQGWFVHWASGWEMHLLSKSLKIWFWMVSFSKMSLLTCPCLMRKRVEKSQAFLASLDALQEQHLDW